MSFQLVFHKAGGTGLVAVCDVCGKRAYSGMANICWLPEGERIVGRQFNFKIACKEDCTRTLDLKEGYQWTQGLDLGLLLLINNTRTNLKDIRRKAENLYAMGMVA